MQFWKFFWRTFWLKGLLPCSKSQKMNHPKICSPQLRGISILLKVPYVHTCGLARQFLKDSVAKVYSLQNYIYKPFSVGCVVLFLFPPLSHIFCQ